MLRELSKIVQIVLQVIIDAVYIYLRVDMDKKVTKPCHLHQRVGKRGWPTLNSCHCALPHASAPDNPASAARSFPTTGAAGVLPRH